VGNWVKVGLSNYQLTQNYRRTYGAADNYKNWTIKFKTESFSVFSWFNLGNSRGCCICSTSTTLQLSHRQYKVSKTVFKDKEKKFKLKVFIKKKYYNCINDWKLFFIRRNLQCVHLVPSPHPSFKEVAKVGKVAYFTVELFFLYSGYLKDY
jgi:hypothetical protein